jgi:hypothetical protein
MLSMFGSGKLGPIVVSCLVVIGFIAVVTMFLLRPITLDGNSTTILTILIGALSNEFGHVVQYHVGSSAGSKAKDDVLHDIARGNSGAPPTPGS